MAARKVTPYDDFRRSAAAALEAYQHLLEDLMDLEELGPRFRSGEMGLSTVETPGGLPPTPCQALLDLVGRKLVRSEADAHLVLAASRSERANRGDSCAWRMARLCATADLVREARRRGLLGRPAIRRAS